MGKPKGGWKNPKAAEIGRTLGGRRKAGHTVEAEAARKKIVEIVNAEMPKLMAEWLNIAYTAKSQAVRASAIKDILERAYGKPKTMLDFGDGEDLGFVVLPARLAANESE